MHFQTSAVKILTICCLDQERELLPVDSEAVLQCILPSKDQSFEASNPVVVRSLSVTSINLAGVFIQPRLLWRDKICLAHT